MEYVTPLPPFLQWGGISQESNRELTYAQPAIGSARQKRWYRANNLGLNPPIEVLAVLIKEEEKGNAKIERAHVDELMSSKFTVGEA